MADIDSVAFSIIGDLVKANKVIQFESISRIIISIKIIYRLMNLKHRRLDKSTTRYSKCWVRLENKIKN